MNERGNWREFPLHNFGCGWFAFRVLGEIPDCLTLRTIFGSIEECWVSTICTWPLTSPHFCSCVIYPSAVPVWLLCSLGDNFRKKKQTWLTQTRTTVMRRMMCFPWGLMVRTSGRWSISVMILRLASSPVSVREDVPKHYSPSTCSYCGTELGSFLILGDGTEN